MTQEPHPDEIKDWQAYKRITRGSRQIIDDEAIEAYLKVFEATGDKRQAEEANKLVYAKYFGYGMDKR